MTERWLTKERRDSYKQKATRTQAGGLDQNHFTDCAIHDLEAADDALDHLNLVAEGYLDSIGRFGIEIGRLEAEVERLRGVFIEALEFVKGLAGKVCEYDCPLNLDGTGFCITCRAKEFVEAQADPEGKES